LTRLHAFEIAGAALLVLLVIQILRPIAPAKRMALFEREAIDTLHTLAAAQETYRSRSGAYGFLPDLLAAEPPLLERRASPWAVGIHEIAGTGYLFRVYLPDRAGRGVPADQSGEVDREFAGRYFGVLAWPQRYDATGQRTFYLHHTETLHYTENLGIPYDGLRSVPSWDAGLRDGSLGMISPPAEDRSHGMDAKIWEVLDGESGGRP